MKDLRSGIEHLKQAKTLMSEANRIMSDHISKLKALEEENARLKAELDDWKGNAEGFQPDEYMKLPLDADGEPIRIGDEVFRLVDGMKLYVSAIELTEEGCLIMAKTSPNLLASGYTGNTLRHKKPEAPDSWEKLEEDMMGGTSCLYFGCTESEETCWDCPHGVERSGTPCWKNERLDILKRAKKLAGIVEEVER